jgi:hypothetical protein
MGGTVDRERPERERRCAVINRRSTQQRSQACPQLQIPRRAGQEVVGPGLEGSQDFELVAAGTEDDHRQPRRPRRIGPLVGSVQAVPADAFEKVERAPWCVELSDHDESRRVRPGQHASVGRGAGELRGMAVGRELFGKLSSQAGVRLDNENRRAFGADAGGRLGAADRDALRTHAAIIPSAAERFVWTSAAR